MVVVRSDHPELLALMKTKKSHRPVIEQHAHYAEYLRDMYEWGKKQPRKLTYEKMAADSGISITLLNLVFKGERRLRPEHINGVAKALSLTPSERKFLTALVKLNDSEDTVERTRALRALGRRKAFREHFQLDLDSLEYLADWRTMVIHELSSIPGIELSAERIREILLPSITASQVEDSLKVLIRLGMLVPDEDGHPRRSVGTVATADEFHTDMVRIYHHQVTALAQWALAQVPARRRNFGTVTGRIREENMATVRQMLHDFRKELVCFFEEEEQFPEARTLMQLNLQLFPLTKEVGHEE